MIQRARAHAHQNLIRFDGRFRRVLIYQNVRPPVLMNPSKLHIEVHCRPSSAAGCYHFVQMRKVLLPLAATLVLLQAQTGARFALTVDNIMRGPGLVGYEPAQVRWSGDSQQIYFQWKQPAQKEDEPMDTYVVDRDGSGLRKLSDDETQLAPPAFGDIVEGPARSSPTSATAISSSTTTATGKTRQLTKTTDAESNPRFLPGRQAHLVHPRQQPLRDLARRRLARADDRHPLRVPRPPPGGAPGTAEAAADGAARAHAHRRADNPRAAPTARSR